LEVNTPSLQTLPSIFTIFERLQQLAARRTIDIITGWQVEFLPNHANTKETAKISGFYVNHQSRRSQKHVFTACARYGTLNHLAFPSIHFPVIKNICSYSITSLRFIYAGEWTVDQWKEISDLAPNLRSCEQIHWQGGSHASLSNLLNTITTWKPTGPGMTRAAYHFPRLEDLKLCVVDFMIPNLCGHRGGTQPQFLGDPLQVQILSQR
jgi:hypothetical protein